MSDATSEVEPSESRQREAASSLSLKLAGAITALTLGPTAALTWLAVWELRNDVTFAFGSIFVLGWTMSLAHLASTRCRNVVARWLLLGPGDFRTRATFGLIIVAGDWLLTALLIRVLAPDGPVRLYVTMACMTGISTTLPFLWWLIVRGRGGRDVVPGVRFFTRTFGTRDLLMGLFLAGLALAGARLAFAYAAPAGGGFSLSTDVAPEFLPPLLSSVAFWLVDLGLRLFILSKHTSVRGLAILAGFLLVLALIPVALATERSVPPYAFFIAGSLWLYAILGAAHEGTLRWFGVRAVNLRNETGAFE